MLRVTGSAVPSVAILKATVTPGLSTHIPLGVHQLFRLLEPITLQICIGAPSSDIPCMMCHLSLFKNRTPLYSELPTRSVALLDKEALVGKLECILGFLDYSI